VSVAIPAARLDRIRALVDERGIVTIREMGDELGVSGMTIRRDLDVLERSGVLRRTRGGALSTARSAIDRPYDERRQLETDAKNQIGNLAASLIEEGDSLFVSSGTTSLAFARQLAGRERITVVTNSVQALAALADEPGLTVISTGGRASREGGHLSGTLAEQALAQFRVRKAFIGASGMTPEGVTNSSLERASIDRLMVEGAAEVYILADHSKFGQVSLALVAPLEEITAVITDDAVAEADLDWLREAGVPVHVARTKHERQAV
jgi:DeoR/GlpR family transcriptional regulator of sugar metabolism